MEFDQNKQEKERDATAAFEPQGGAGFTARLEIAATGGWKFDQLEGAVIGEGGECLGR